MLFCTAGADTGLCFISDEGDDNGILSIANCCTLTLAMLRCLMGSTVLKAPPWRAILLAMALNIVYVCAYGVCYNSTPLSSWLLLAL